jgi:hypothetical protein
VSVWAWARVRMRMRMRVPPSSCAPRPLRRRGARRYATCQPRSSVSLCANKRAQRSGERTAQVAREVALARGVPAAVLRDAAASAHAPSPQARSRRPALAARRRAPHAPSREPSPAPRCAAATARRRREAASARAAVVFGVRELAA